MSLRKIFETAYGSTEKTAEDIYAKFLGDEADSEKEMKLAEAYDELGRGLARETFAQEILGQEKTAGEEILQEIFAGVDADADGEADPDNKTASEEGAEETETETETEETEEEGEKIASDQLLEHFLGIEKEAEVEIEGAEEYELKLASTDKEAAVAFKVIKEAAKGGKGKKLWESIKALAGKKGTKGKKAKGFLAKGIAAVKGAPKATQKSLRAAYKASMKAKGVATGAAAAGAAAGLAGGYAAGKSKKK